MPIQKKKKKKEEFDASLMGGYIPGAKRPVSIIPVTSFDKAMMVPFWQTRWRYGSGDVHESTSKPPPSPRYDYRELGEAWWSYTGVPAMVAGGLSIGLLYQMGAQPLQVWKGGSIFSAAKFGFGAATVLEITIGTALWAAVMTALDPSHKWSGGLDETRYFMGEPEAGWGSGTKSDFGWKRTTPWAEGTGFQG